MPRHGSNSTQVDRNALERERRMYMKDLCSRLALFVPTPPSKTSLSKLLDQATTHVKQLKQRVEMLNRRKQLVEGNSDTTAAGIRDLMTGGSRSSVITVCDLGSVLQICLTSGLNKKFMLYQVIDVLVEEAAQVVALSYSIIGDRIFYTIQVQVLFKDLENMPRHGSNSTQVDRNALERERRMCMKDLFSRLAFLVPAPSSKASLPELLDQATTHVKQLKQRVEMLLRQRKQLVEGNTDTTAAGIRDLMTGGSRSSVITVCDLGSILQICLTTGLNKKFMLYQVIDVLVEEAAQVVALSYSIIGDGIFYTIHVQAVSSRIGIETSRVQERLQELIF